MINFCSKCGAKIENSSSNVCPKCGNKFEEGLSSNNPTTTLGIKCLYCGENIPIGSDKCLKCGKYVNPDANQDHKAVVIVGYICSFVPCLSLIALILGIYLITRPNKEVHKHGVIIIILSIILSVAWFFIITSLYTSYFFNTYNTYNYPAYDNYKYY